MPHDCTDWSKSPPSRKAPYFLLRRGDDYIYTIVPADLKALEDIARKEFNLGDADIRISSACGNLWNGEPARITEGAWALVSTCIGCATVEVVAVDPPVAQEQPPPMNVLDPVARARFLNPDDQRLAGPAEEQPAHGEPDAPAGHDMADDRAHTPENRHHDDDNDESMASPRKARQQRRVESDNEDEPEDRHASATSQIPAPASPERVIKKERQGVARSEPDSKITAELDKPIKEEKGDTATYSQADAETLVQVPSEPMESNKLMIRVAHRPSKQESKFTTKSTTKVHKVLAGVCKSFDLDVSRASLHLIVSTEDELGEEENLFPCDKNDSIARAGAQHDTESRFLLKIAGEP